MKTPSDPMVCDICKKNAAVHEIDGWLVCADQHCKMEAWRRPAFPVDNTPDEQAKNDVSL